MLTDAGVRLGSAAEGRTGQTTEHSYEQLDVLADCDVLLVASGPDGGPGPEATGLLSSPLWSTLPAVRAGNVFPFPYGTSSLGMGLDQLAELEAVLGQLRER